MFAIAMLPGAVAVASQEGVLRLNSFRLSSPGIGQSGPVAISGEQSAKRLVSLTVQAFGHTVSLSKDQLAKLRGGFFNGLQMSYEAGYRESGGRIVYIVVSKGFTSGAQETQVISVNEHGRVAIKEADAAWRVHPFNQAE